MILYHSIGPVREGQETGDEDVREMGLVTPLDVLEEHLTRLIGLGYRFVTAGELAARWTGEAPPAGLAVLTFDDGWRDGFTRAAMSLSRFGVTGTFYICPGALGGRIERFGDAGALLTRHEALSLHEAGMELGSHTLSHHNILELDDDGLHRELAGSRAMIEALTGAPCLTLAYPSGRHDARVERAAGEAGYRAAFACTPGPWRRFAAPRWQAPVLDHVEVVDRRLELETRQRWAVGDRRTAVGDPGGAEPARGPRWPGAAC